MNEPDSIGFLVLPSIDRLSDRGAIAVLRIYRRVEVIKVREDT
jgi:hypothetical protein